MVCIQIFTVYVSFQGQEIDDSQFQIRFAQESEYPETYTSTKPYEIIKPSTMNAFTVEFEMRSLITNCNSSITRMTPCLEKAYDILFGSDYDGIVSSKNLTHWSFYFYNPKWFFFSTLGQKD